MGAIEEQVKANLPDAANPMELIQKIMERDSTKPLEAPKVEEPKVETKPAEEPKAPVEVAEEPKAPVETKPTEEPKASEVVEEILSGKELNFAKLRKSNEELKAEIKKKEEEQAKLMEELEGLRTGTIVPEFVAEKEKRIKELERYEKIYALKSSPEYRSRFVEPVQKIKENLKGILKAYDAPEGLEEQLLNVENPRELNQYLRDNFDDLDAIEIKKHLKDARSILASAKEAENEPQKILEELERSHAEVVQSRMQVISTKAKTAWERSLLDIQKEGKIVELIPRPDDTEFNKTYVEPITVKAATEYGKIVTMLAKHGLTELPDDLAYALAQMTQRAHTSAVAHETRDRALSLVEELVENSRRKTSYERPKVGITHGPNGNMAPKAESREDRINSLLDAGRQYARR